MSDIWMEVYSGGLFHSYNEFKPMTPAGLSRWAYLSDFINCQKELIRTYKALGMALDWLREVTTPAKCDDELCREFTKRKLTEIKTILEQKD